MNIFGISVKFRRQPRWASYEQVQELSKAVQSLYNAYEAMRKKVYRDAKPAPADGEIAPIVDLATEEIGLGGLVPGAVLSEAQIQKLFGG